MNRILLLSNDITIGVFPREKAELGPGIFQTDAPGKILIILSPSGKHITINDAGTEHSSLTEYVSVRYFPLVWKMIQFRNNYVVHKYIGRRFMVSNNLRSLSYSTKLSSFWTFMPVDGDVRDDSNWRMIAANTDRSNYLSVCPLGRRLKLKQTYLSQGNYQDINKYAQQFSPHHRLDGSYLVDVVTYSAVQALQGEVRSLLQRLFAHYALAHHLAPLEVCFPVIDLLRIQQVYAEEQEEVRLVEAFCSVLLTGITDGNNNGTSGMDNAALARDLYPVFPHHQQCFVVTERYHYHIYHMTTSGNNGNSDSGNVVDLLFLQQCDNQQLQLVRQTVLPYTTSNTTSNTTLPHDLYPTNTTTDGVVPVVEMWPCDSNSSGNEEVLVSLAANHFHLHRLLPVTSNHNGNTTNNTGNPYQQHHYQYQYDRVHCELLAQAILSSPPTGNTNGNNGNGEMVTGKHHMVQRAIDSLRTRQAPALQLLYFQHYLATTVNLNTSLKHRPDPYSPKYSNRVSRSPVPSSSVLGKKHGNYGNGNGNGNKEWVVEQCEEEVQGVGTVRYTLFRSNSTGNSTSSNTISTDNTIGNTSAVPVQGKIQRIRAIFPNHNHSNNSNNDSDGDIWLVQYDVMTEMVVITLHSGQEHTLSRRHYDTHTGLFSNNNNNNTSSNTSLTSRVSIVLRALHRLDLTAAERDREDTALAQLHYTVRQTLLHNHLQLTCALLRQPPPPPVAAPLIKPHNSYQQHIGQGEDVRSLVSQALSLCQSVTQKNTNYLQQQQQQQQHSSSTSTTS